MDNAADYNTCRKYKHAADSIADRVVDDVIVAELDDAKPTDPFKVPLTQRDIVYATTADVATVAPGADRKLLRQVACPVVAPVARDYADTHVTSRVDILPVLVRVDSRADTTATAVDDTAEEPRLSVAWPLPLVATSPEAI